MWSEESYIPTRYAWKAENLNIPVESNAFSYDVCGVFLFSTFCNFFDKTFLSLEYAIAGAFLLFDILLVLVQVLRTKKVPNTDKFWITDNMWRYYKYLFLEKHWLLLLRAKTALETEACLRHSTCPDLNS